MRLLPNVGTDRVLDWLRAAFAPGAACDAATPELSLFAFAELRNALEAAAACRLLMPDGDPGLLGGEADSAARNRLETRRLAAACVNWLESRCTVRTVPALPQSAVVVRPGGAVVLKHEGRHRLYFVVETKSTLDLFGLRQEEKDKIHCGQRHFEALADGPDAAEFVQVAEFGDVLAKAAGVV